MNHVRARARFYLLLLFLLGTTVLFARSVGWAQEGVGAKPEAGAVQAEEKTETDVSAGEEQKAVPGEEAKAEETESAVAPPKLTAAQYPTILGFSSRIIVWIVAQLHLFFGAFVLGVPIFVLVIEGIGMASKDPRYDEMAHEFIKISLVAFSFTATLGGLLVFLFILLYPDFFKFLTGVFKPFMAAYALMFFAESISLYLYYYAWDSMKTGFPKWVHLTIGLLLNVSGMTIMCLSNGWTSFMMTPAGLDAMGTFHGDYWAALRNPLWNPLNLHRFIANIAYGGSIVGAYAAFKFLTSNSDKEKAHYDWMGYTSNFIAVSALLPLPFAGYWLTLEMYSFSQQLGITLMGGIFAWVFIIQAVLIGALFLGANYYLWTSMARITGSERYVPLIKYMAVLLVICFLIWFTPHTIVMTAKEIRALGGAHHPILGYFGVMSAKNTAVNLMISTTYLSFLLFQRSSKISTASWNKTGNILVASIFLAGAANIIFLGVYGYYLPANIRIGLSVPQVCTTLFIILSTTLIDKVMYRKSDSTGPIPWGKMPQRAQYILVLLAISFTWLMGLMGYARSGIRQHWHVYTVMRDNSVDAFTPTLGYAAQIISLTVVIFMMMVIFIFWLGQISGKKKKEGYPAESPARAG